MVKLERGKKGKKEKKGERKKERQTREKVRGRQDLWSFFVGWF